MRKFNNNFEDFDKNFKRVQKLGIVVMVLNAVLGFGLLGVFVWIIAHFLKKLW